MIPNTIGAPCLHWCVQALPTVFDASLSYYEMVCKLKMLMEKVLEGTIGDEEEIETIKASITALDNKTSAKDAELQEEIDSLQNIINQWEAGGKEFFTEWFEKNFPSVVYFGLTDSGYFFVSCHFLNYVPLWYSGNTLTWSEVRFNTTGVDIFPEGYEYGRLTLSY